ncbi:MAG: type II toxin-antitoxin system HigA family antitoxin [Ruegeria sp.]
MDIFPIRTKEDHIQALKEIERLWGAEQGTEDGTKLDILVDLVEHFEDQHYPIEAPDPIELLNFFMEENGLTQTDFGNVIGSQPRASEVLNKKRALNLGMIRKLSTVWKIPAEPLIVPYHLEN